MRIEYLACLCLSTIGIVGCTESDDPGLRAWVYPRSPSETPDLEEISLRELTDPDGLLTGHHLAIMNCLKEPAPEGDSSTCSLGQVATAGAEDYLHIRPPADHFDPSDAYAEVSAYYHLERARLRFVELGLTPREHPLLAIVNLMFYAPPLRQWFSFDNAGFIAAGYLPELGFNSEDAGFVLGQGLFVDWSYDGDTLYHEFTHSVIGERLRFNRADAYGLDTTPHAVDEAIADYFAQSIVNDPVPSAYAYDGLRRMFEAQNAPVPPNAEPRILSEMKTCATDFTGEPHLDGSIFSSALWAMREKLGREQSDQIVFDTIQRFDRSAGFADATEILLARASEDGADVRSAIEPFFAERGLLDCPRVTRYQDFPDDPARFWSPISMEGLATVELPEFQEFVPALPQQVFDVADGAASIRLLVTIPNGAPPADLRLAWRRGEPVTYRYGEGGSQTEADVVVPFVPDGHGYVAEVSGSFLEGTATHYFHLQNLGQDPVSIQGAKLEVVR